MNVFLREKSDGRRTAGYLVYLLAGMGAVAALIFLHRRTVVSGVAPGRRPQARVSNVAPITQPAAIMSQVEVAARPSASDARSYRIGRVAQASRLPSSEMQAGTPAGSSRGFGIVQRH